jgi:S-adenosylmethionine decarboxylase
MKPSVGEQTFGMEVILDLAECDPKTIRSRESLVTFAKELCRVIDMKAYGEPLAVRFGLNEPKTAGYSLVQLIETSSITGHFSEEWNKAYINIFSCKTFDADVATEFTKQFFGAKSFTQTVVVRG